MHETDGAGVPRERFDTVCVSHSLEILEADVLKGVLPPDGVLVRFRLEQAVAVGTRNNEKRGLGHRTVIDEDGCHDALRLGHAVDRVPRRIVLMPVPCHSVAEPLLGIQATLMEIHLVSQQLSHGVDQSRQKTQAPEWLGIGMGAEGETDRL